MYRILVLIFLLSAACNTKSPYTTFTSDPVRYCKTVKELNNIVLENNFPPMIATRNYAYANIAAYECMVAGDTNWQTLAGQILHLPALPRMPIGTDIDYDLAALLAFVKVGNTLTFPEGSMMGHYNRLIAEADSIGIPKQMLENTKKFSDSVSSAIIEWSKNDNYSKTGGASRFSLDESSGRWVPSSPSYATGLEQHWMEVRPMVLDSVSVIRCPKPPAYDIKNRNSTYYKALMEVKRTADSLTEEQKQIADFWDDNPFKMNVPGYVYASKRFSPAGHWINIVGIGAEKSGADLHTTIAAYAKTSIAIFDAFLSCWDEKYRSNYIRPETVITQLIDPNWQPYIQTPPFPSYVSDHSTISGAAAEVMSEYFGDIAFTDTSSKELGMESRHFQTFRDAAQEASISRLYGGIHYRFDLDEGNMLGRKVGEMVVKRIKLQRPGKAQALSKK